MKRSYPTLRLALVLPAALFVAPPPRHTQANEIQTPKRRVGLRALIIRQRGLSHRQGGRGGRRDAEDLVPQTGRRRAARPAADAEASPLGVCIHS